MSFLSYFNIVYFENPLKSYLYFVLILIAGFIIGKIIHKKIITKLQIIFTKKKETNNLFKIIISFLEKTTVFIIFWIVFYFGKNIFIISDDINSYINVFINIIIIIKLVPTLTVLIDEIINLFYKKYQNTEEIKLDKQLTNILSLFFKLTLRLTASIFIISQLGYNITSLIAGLGIWGIAIAMAAKDTLANFFGSLTLFLDKPFKIGDTVKIGDLKGTIKEIGIRSTKIKSFSDTYYIIPNNNLSNQTIENISKRKGIRFDEEIGLIYETPNDKIEEAISIIKKIIADHPDSKKKVIRVYLSKFGDFSLNLKINYYMNVPKSWNTLVIANSQMKLQIKEQFEKAGIEFAYPTQLLLNREVK